MRMYDEYIELSGTAPWYNQRGLYR